MNDGSKTICGRIQGQISLGSALVLLNLVLFSTTLFSWRRIEEAGLASVADAIGEWTFVTAFALIPGTILYSFLRARCGDSRTFDFLGPGLAIASPALMIWEMSLFLEPGLGG
jgi:hypothetical protein